MNDSLSNAALAWLLTYAIHSTALLGLAWLVTRRPSAAPATRDFIWKAALVGGVLTATAQTQFGLQPSGSFSLAAASTRAASGTTRSHAANADENTPATAGKPEVGLPEMQSQANAPDAETTKPAATSPSNLALPAILVAGWAAVALILAGIYAARRLILVGRLTDRSPVTEGPLPAMLESLRREAGHRGRVRLTTAGMISSPVALGLGEICVPHAALTDLDPEQQRGLLAHELAHLARRDPVWLGVASIIERVFFFQPLNRLARRELQQAAEYLCDDWAVAKTGSGLPLARCLARVAEWIQLSPLGVPVAGMAEQRSLLVSRIARLIEGRASGSPAPRIVMAGVAVVLFGSVVAAAPGVRHQDSLKSAGKPAQESNSKGRSDSLGLAANGIETPAPPIDTVVENALIERLKDSDAGVRRAAISALANLKSRRAIPGIIAALTDKNRDVRAAAAEALGELRDDRAIHGLSALVSDESADVREHALDALSHYAHDVQSSLILPSLQDSRANIRAKGLEVLGEIGDHASVAPISRLLKDPSADVRHAAVHALEQIGDPSSAPLIASATSDENAEVRSSALSALRELKVPVAEKTVLQALADESADVRQEGLQLINDRPFAAAVAPAQKLLDDPNENVREAAIEALASIRTPAAREALRAALKSKDPNVRRRATEALGERP